MKPSFVPLTVATFVFALAQTTNLAAKQDLPAALAGTWVGSGTINKSPRAPRERVRCRFSANWKSRASSMSLRYICLGIDVKFETTGALSYSAAKKSISGRLVTVGIGAFTAAGKHRGNRITLNLRGKDKATGKPLTGTMVLVRTGTARLTSTLSATDPKTGKPFRAFKAVFKR